MLRTRRPWRKLIARFAATRSRGGGIPQFEEEDGTPDVAALFAGPPGRRRRRDDARARARRMDFAIDARLERRAGSASGGTLALLNSVDAAALIRWPPPRHERRGAASRARRAPGARKRSAAGTRRSDAGGGVLLPGRDRARGWISGGLDRRVNFVAGAVASRSARGSSCAPRPRRQGVPARSRRRACTRGYAADADAWLPGNESEKRAQGRDATSRRGAGENGARRARECGCTLRMEVAATDAPKERRNRGLDRYDTVGPPAAARAGDRNDVASATLSLTIVVEGVADHPGQCSNTRASSGCAFTSWRRNRRARDRHGRLRRREGLAAGEGGGEAGERGSGENDGRVRRARGRERATFVGAKGRKPRGTRGVEGFARAARRTGSSRWRRTARPRPCTTPSLSTVPRHLARLPATPRASPRARRRRASVRDGGHPPRVQPSPPHHLVKRAESAVKPLDDHVAARQATVTQSTRPGRAVPTTRQWEAPAAATGSRSSRANRDCRRSCACSFPPVQRLGLADPVSAACTRVRARVLRSRSRCLIRLSIAAASRRRRRARRRRRLRSRLRSRSRASRSRSRPIRRRRRVEQAPPAGTAVGRA